MAILAKAVVVFLLFLTLLSFAAMALGAFQPLHPALAGFLDGCEGKPEPCWNGIVPGMTTVGEAQQILLDNAYVPEDFRFVLTGAEAACDVYHTGIDEEATVSSVTLLNCENLNLGQVMGVLGRPDWVIRDCFNSAVFVYDDRLFLYSQRLSYAKLWLTPYTGIRVIGISPQNSDYRSLVDGYDWHGFAPYRRYQQLQSEVKGCWR